MMRDMTCYFSQDNGAKIGSILLRMDAMASMGGVIGQGRRNRVGEGHFVRSVNLIPTEGGADYTHHITKVVTFLEQ